MIPYGKQKIGKDDVKEIINVSRSTMLTTGPKVLEFEKKLKNYTKAKFAVSCNSGTSALHLAFLSINLQPGDIIIMPAINFIATFNICKLLNAKIYLADVDPIKGVVTPKNILDVIKNNKLKKIKAIVTMHLGGKVEQTEEFFNLKKKFKFFLIEDSCHAFGSKYIYRDKYFNVGCAKHADLSTFSFHPIKSITTGEGGAVTTNNKSLHERMKLFKSHGIIRSKSKHWEYDIASPGLNFRLSDINCALGISQLKKINLFMRERVKIAKFYEQEFRKFDFKVIFPKVSKIQNSWHLYVVNFTFKSLGEKDKFFKYLKKNKIIAQFHYIPIYNFSIGKKYKKLPGCEKYFKSAVSIPIYVGLKKTQQLKVEKTNYKFFKKKN